MPINPTVYRKVRRRQLAAAHMDPRAANYIIDLELRTTETIVKSIADLRNQPKWQGKQVLLAYSGRYLSWLNGRWRLI